MRRNVARRIIASQKTPDRWPVPIQRTRDRLKNRISACFKWFIQHDKIIAESPQSVELFRLQVKDFPVTLDHPGTQAKLLIEV
jgi:hypothetical protein